MMTPPEQVYLKLALSSCQMLAIPMIFRENNDKPALFLRFKRDEKFVARNTNSQAHCLTLS